MQNLLFFHGTAGSVRLHGPCAGCLAAALSLFFAALPLSCPASGPDPVSQAPAQAEAPAGPEYGGRIIIGSIGEPSNLIPYLSSDASSAEVAGLLYTSPLEYDRELNIVKCAAEEWEVLEGGLLMKFRLKPGIVWEDGEPLTADDVAFTYRLMTDPRTPTAYAGDFMTISEFRQTGPLSFEVRYKEPYARAAMTWMHPILPKHVLEKEDIASTRYARHPVGAGPYRLKSWEAGSRITLAANDRYFKGRPYIDEVVYRFIPDGSTMFLEARAGRLDDIGLSPQQYLRQTQGGSWDTDWRKYKYPASGYTYVGLNQKSPFFRDRRVRQALSYALDRRAIIKGALLGMGEPAFGPYKPGTWASNASLSPYPCDPAKARRLLAEAGWTPGADGILHRDGLPFEFTLLVNQGNEERIKTAVIIQQMLRAVGVKVSVRTVEWAAFLKEFVGTRRFDALILGWNILDDPDVHDVWHSSAIAGNGLNFVGFSNPEADSLLEKGRIMTDKEGRKKLYDRFQEILHEEQPYLFLYVPYSLPMIRSRYRGIDPAPAGISWNFDRWWVPRILQK